MGFKNMETVQAELTNIRFKNDDGFLIGQFTSEDSSFAGLGKMFKPEKGMDYLLHGQYSEHPTFGNQFKFDHYEVVKPKNTAGIYRYLVRVARLVGPAVADRLIEAFGIDTLEILEKEPDRAADQIKGLTLIKAGLISTKLLEDKNLRSVIVELESILDIPGIKKSLSIDLVEKYGSDAVSRIKDNPYLLTHFKQVGFKTADTIAIQKLNICPDSIFRITAASIHIIKEQMASPGHIWIDENTFYQELWNLTLIPIHKLQPIVERVVKSEAITFENQMFTLLSAKANESLIARVIYQISTNIPEQTCLLN